MTARLEKEARGNLEGLAANLYPGRGIVVGTDASGKFMAQVYWIMGRSENSRNRIMVTDHQGAVDTAPADPSKVEDPSLIIYRAMASRPNLYIVSNGHQTDNTVNGDRPRGMVMGDMVGMGLHDVMLEWQYEPDAPNYTPRISAVCNFRGEIVTEFSILRKSPFGDECDRAHYSYAVTPGYGRCVHTYRGDGSPLPSFVGEPYLVPIEGDNAQHIAEDFWDKLNADNRVSLAVKLIEIDTGYEHQAHIINARSAVEA